MDDLYARRLAKKLNPESIRTTVNWAGLFLLAYELLKSDVIDGTQRFFDTGMPEDGSVGQGRYKTDVLDLSSSKFEASARWLAQQGAIDDSDVLELLAIREHRNEVAHELAKLLVDPNTGLDAALLERCRHFIHKIGRFWGEMEAEFSGQFDGQELRNLDIQSGAMLLIDHVWEAFNSAPG